MYTNTHLEWAHEGLVYTHHGPGIIKLPAIIGCWEKSYELSLGKELVSILHYLMRPTDEVHVVLV